MIAVSLIWAVLPLLLWLGIALGKGFFWLARERDDGAVSGKVDAGFPSENATIQENLPVLARWPSVVAVVPARDEAEVIARSLASLLKQDYPGKFRIVLVDDQSLDATAEIAKGLADPRLTVLEGRPHPAGWTGKLYAVAQGVATARDADYLWLTDADIEHAPDNLRQLVTRAEAGSLVLTSLMAKLACESFAEKALVPAFVFFFAMLYPFAFVNDARRGTAAAAGGCMLVKRESLDAAGGVEAIRGEIIDDCALARRMKTQGPIFLGLTERAVSIRPYPKIGDIGAMVSRSACAELDYSPLKLVGTVIGLLLLFVMPIAGLAVGGMVALGGALSWAAMTVLYQPMLHFYKRSPLWGLALPAIGLAYAWFTIASFVQDWQGCGGMWKGRVQARLRR